ncbi:hypothetical protein DsansV1_C26g0195471 [Dioscorea sansibarensis]
MFACRTINNWTCPSSQKIVVSKSFYLPCIANVILGIHLQNPEMLQNHRLI